MPKFKAKHIKTVVKTAVYEIEADSPEEAERINEAIQIDAFVPAHVKQIDSDESGGEYTSNIIAGGK